MHGLNRALVRLIRLYQWAFEPNAQRIPIEARRQRRVLTAVFLMFIPIVVVVSQWDIVPPDVGNFLLLVGGVMCVALLFNRTRYYRVAAWLLLLTNFSIPFAVLHLLDYPSGVDTTTALIFCNNSVILAYLLFKPRVVVLVFIGNIVGMLLLPRYNPLTAHAIYVALLFNLTASSLSIVASVLRHLYLREQALQAQALQEGEERYRSLFDAALDPIIIHRGAELLEANPAFGVLFSLPLRGASLYDLVLPGNHARIDEYLNLPPETPFELDTRAADGTRVRVEMRGKEIMVRGTRVRMTAFRDITERVRAETERIELSVEREKVKLLQKFIGTISHDLRTPLTVIKTSLYLTKRLIDDPERRERHLDLLEGQVVHMQRLLEDLLSMSKLDRADTDEFRFRLVNLNELVGDGFLEHHAIAQRKGHTLIFRPLHELPSVLVDEGQFMRMLRHLLINAINYTPNGGTIVLETRLYAINNLEGDTVDVCIRDNGIGISPTDLPHIFEHFYRADAARNSEQGGTGLGLTIARRIAEAHGGDILVESTLGTGSTFIVRLPVVRELTLTPTEAPTEG